MNENNRWRVLAVSTDPQAKFRLSESMRSRLKNQAKANGRTFNNEVLFRLAETLYRDDIEINFKQGGNNENI